MSVSQSVSRLILSTHHMRGTADAMKATGPPFTEFIKQTGHGEGDRYYERESINYGSLIYRDQA